MIIRAHLHSGKESMLALGEKSGLRGDVLDHFQYALYDVVVDLAVEESTGAYAIVAVDGEPLASARIAELTREVDRQRKLTALWKRLHWAVTEYEYRSGSMESGEARRECIDKLRALGEDPKHATGDPDDDGAGQRMAYAPQPGGGQEGE